LNPVQVTQGSLQFPTGRADMAPIQFLNTEYRLFHKRAYLDGNTPDFKEFLIQFKPVDGV
jgi:hypothetical protein